eukprot:805861-Prymnesium_polylepis.1
MQVETLESLGVRSKIFHSPPPEVLASLCDLLLERRRSLGTVLDREETDRDAGEGPASEPHE